jgi:ArsR family transcriptional regulator, lead/cadmium/zinc/bismuth-responsive transcriptional repressor
MPMTGGAADWRAGTQRLTPGQDGVMHLVRGGRRIIDQDHRVCDAIAAVSDQPALERWANVFAMLGNPRRLALLVSIHRAGRICVSDLAAATALKEATVSQALRLLRRRGAVVADRDGRLVRYALADDHMAALVDRVTEGGGPSQA